jgi:HAD superfamily hydrolase (TIGR01509 family)
MKPFSCIIFDIDGTLSQTNELIFATFNHIAEKYLGRTYTSAEIIAMFGPPEEIAVERLVGKEKFDEAIADFYLYYEEHYPRLADKYQGVDAVLEYLKECGVPLAVFTGKGARTTRITLDKLGIGGYFDLVVTGSDVVAHKPSAEGIRKVLKAFGVRKEEALMVGDAVADVKAAREAGIRVAAVLWDSYGKDKILEMNVDYRFHSVEEFSRWIRKTFPKKRARRESGGRVRV